MNLKEKGEGPLKVFCEFGNKNLISIKVDKLLPSD
jgi:hypothetical protein